MLWADTARREPVRKCPRNSGDLRDAEWAPIAPLFPAACSGGRRRTTCLRGVMDAIVDIAPSGCAWQDTGLLTTINYPLVMAAREQVGQRASPSAGVIDSQSAKTTEKRRNLWL